MLKATTEEWSTQDARKGKDCNMLSQTTNHADYHCDRYFKVCDHEECRQHGPPADLQKDDCYKEVGMVQRGARGDTRVWLKGEIPEAVAKRWLEQDDRRVIDWRGEHEVVEDDGRTKYVRKEGA